MHLHIIYPPLAAVADLQLVPKGPLFQITPGTGTVHHAREGR
jgi:hypothetical protein